MSRTQQKSPPRDNTGNPGGTTQQRQKQQTDNQDTLLTFNGGDTHQPPWFVFLLAWKGIGTGFSANAFHTMIVSDRWDVFLYCRRSVYPTETQERNSLWYEGSPGRKL